MPGDKVQVLGAAPGEKESIKRAYYAGADTIKNGYALCYDRDYGTATDTEWERASQVEKPAAGNLHNFAGLVTGLPSAGKTGPCRVNLVDARVPQICVGYTALTATVVDSTILSVKPASYYLGGIGEGLTIGRAMETVSAAGELLMELVPPRRDDLYRRLGTPAAAVNVFSSKIWETFPGEDACFGFFDDFMMPSAAFADAAENNGYTTDQDTGVTIQAIETLDEPGGILEIANNDADLDFGMIWRGVDALFLPFYIAAATFKPFWWEARLKIAGTLTDDDSLGIFIGLGEAGLCLTDGTALVDNTSEVLDENHIGFQVLTADADALLPVFRADGQTKANGTSVAIVSNTYVNVGMVGDGTTIVSYINNVSKHAITAALIAGATFPSATYLTPMLLTKTGGAVENACQMDWWKFYQLR